jgi:preprotein translocase subunit SecA
MLNKLITKIVGSRNERLVKKMGKAVADINALEDSVKALSDEELKAKTRPLRWCGKPRCARLACGITTSR